MYKYLTLVGILAKKGQLFMSLISSLIAPLKHSCVGPTQMPHQNTSVGSGLWDAFMLENEHLLSAVFTALCVSWIGLFNGSEAMTEKLHNKGSFWQSTRRPPRHTGEAENPKSVCGVPSFSHLQVIDKTRTGRTCS